MRHLLLHAAGNMRAHALRLVQLHDIALLAPRLDAAAWERLLDTPESRRRQLVDVAGAGSHRATSRCR